MTDWTGVMPATLCPFDADDQVDTAGLRRYGRWLADHDGITALVCNGHTGEVMSLRARERVAVTQTLADEVGDSTPIVSGVSAEGSDDAIDQARAAKAAGAAGILLMPPHHWLRFGRTAETAVGFVQDVAEAVDIPIILHQYPSWTRASYSLAEMLRIVDLSTVECIKMGTRDMARWGHDYRTLKDHAPAVSIVTCHDEFLLPTLVEGADGALVGFAGFAPELIVALVSSALGGDLAAAQRAQASIRPLAEIIYRFGEPSSDAHQRMKFALTALGRFPSARMRRPLRPLDGPTSEDIRTRLASIFPTATIAG